MIEPSEVRVGGPLESLGEAVLLTDTDGRVTALNEAARDLLGVEADALDRPLTSLLELPEGVRCPPSDADRLVVPVILPDRDADAVASLRRVVDDDGEVVGGSAVVVELGDLRGGLSLAGGRERRLRALLHASTDLISVHGADMRERYVAGRGLSGVGAPSSLRARVHPDDLPRLERGFARWLAGERPAVRYRARGRTGEWRTYESIGTNLLDDPAVEGIVVTTRDVEEQVRLQQELVHRALHDHLTGLPSRALFLDRLEQSLAFAHRVDAGVAVLRVDVDGFRGINEGYGQAAGDAVLRRVAVLLQEVVHRGDPVARLGGDEFAVCCQGMGGREAAEQLAEGILTALEDPTPAGGPPVPVTVSVGIAVAEPGTQLDAETALSRSEAALHAAKQRGGRSVVLYDEAMGFERSRRNRLRRDLLAVEEDQLAVHYQPQVQLSTGQITGFEALLRWHHPLLGAVGPDEFIPLAEETGLILPLGRFVLERACRDLAALPGPGRRPLRMSVNVSTRQLTDDSLPAFLQDVLQETGVDPDRLCLEITESAVLERGEESEELLRQLKACGIQLSIDDFGTGYSSLAYLKRFPLDQVKIDREFVRGLGTNPQDAVIIASVARLGASLQLEVVAEGVETSDHRDEVASLGCHVGQGFLWSRPRPADELPDVLGQAAGWTPATADVTARDLEAVDVPDVDEVVAVLRHELANPVTVIQGYTELLQASEGGGAGPPVTDALAAIRRSTAGLQSLIQVLTDLRHLGAGTVELALEPVDIGAVVRAVLADMEADLGDRPMSFVQEGEAVTRADRRRVRQIVRALVDNAVRHTPPRTAVDVRVGPAGDHHEVRVADRGPGISPEEAEQLFRKFSRVGAQGEGTGLGLFVARGLARAHGGDLVHQRPAHGTGAEFVLRLPAKPFVRPAPG